MMDTCASSTDQRLAQSGSTREQGVRRLTELLEQLRQATLTAPDGRHFQVTFSAGVAESADDGPNLDSLCRAGNRALYLAKHAGRNRVLPFGPAPHTWPLGLKCGGPGASAAGPLVAEDT
jgi:GGDEF domain-containing protein